MYRIIAKFDTNRATLTVNVYRFRQDRAWKPKFLFDMPLPRI